MSDNETCKAGRNDYNNSFDFPADKKIVKVETIMARDSRSIGQIIFYDSNGEIVKINNNYENANGARQTFEIGPNERLIGCELQHGDSYFVGVTWLKWRLN